ncbi:hypothetical protein ACTFIU_001814 [Dictyostelium citrinum]
MATIFDILNTLNNNNNSYNYSCKRQGLVNTIDIIPSIDVTMTKDMILVETELAGISKDDIEIDIKNSILTIKGEKKKNSFQQKLQLQQSKIDQEFEEDDDDELKAKNSQPLSKKLENKSNKDKVFISDRSFGKFKRQLDLSKVLYQLDLSSIKTKFENGLLTISINKKVDYSDSLKILIK